MMMTMDIERARFNMIEQQIRPAEVLDPRVLETIATTPRETFVPADYRDLAFSDTNIPLGHGQVMMKPILEARLLQALNVQPSDKILEIGTGSGYFTALLAKLGGHVYSVEILPELLEQARVKLAALNINNITLEQGDAAGGWDGNNPFDVIAVTGSLPILPESFQRGLTVGGRMVVIVGTAPAMEVRLITRVSEESWTSESLFETVLPALINAAQPPAFVF